MQRILAVLTIIVVIAAINYWPRAQAPGPWTYPHLPYPVAKKRVLVTPAGQSSDGLIVAGMLKDLVISHAYRKKASGEDATQWFESLILVLGNSNAGLDRAGMSMEDEMERIQGLISATQLKAGAVIVIHLGGKNRRSSKDDLLIRRFAPQANYILVVEGGNHDNLFGSIAERGGIPITLARDISALKAPLNSAYR